MHFYEFAVFGSHEIEINSDQFVFFVIKIHDRLSIQNAGTDCGDQFSHWRGIELFIPHKFPAGNSQRQTGSGDCGRACSSIGLQDIAIDPDRARPELLQVDDCSQRTTNQSLNLYTATIDAAFCNVARFRVCVEYGSIEYSAVSQPPVTACSFIQRGTASSIVTPQITRV